MCVYVWVGGGEGQHRGNATALQDVETRGANSKLCCVFRFEGQRDTDKDLAKRKIGESVYAGL